MTTAGTWNQTESVRCSRGNGEIAMKWFVYGSAVLGLLPGLTRNAQANYIFTTLDVPGSTGTSAFGINNAGQIVGSYFDPDGLEHGFLLSSGYYATLDVPGATNTVATGINTSGQIVGIYNTGNFINRGFLLSGGSYTNLDVPGATETQPRQINNPGVVVGDYFLGGIEFGFLLNGGVYTTLDPLTAAYGINNAGQIVGASGEHGYLLSGGTLVSVDVPGASGQPSRQQLQSTPLARLPVYI
jgi:probable HAF family extracellular repeat protein